MSKTVVEKFSFSKLKIKKVNFFTQSLTKIFWISVFNVEGCLANCLTFRPYVICLLNKVTKFSKHFIYIYTYINTHIYIWNNSIFFSLSSIKGQLRRKNRYVSIKQFFVFRGSSPEMFWISDWLFEVSTNHRKQRWKLTVLCRKTN